MSRGSLVGITTGYELNDRGVGVGVPVGSRILTSPYPPNGSGIHLTFCPMGTEGSFPGCKAAGA
jgi:hypothetical protein